MCFDRLINGIIHVLNEALYRLEIFLHLIQYKSDLVRSGKLNSLNHLTMVSIFYYYFLCLKQLF